MTARKHTPTELKHDLNILKTALMALQNPEYLAKLKAKQKISQQQISEIREDVKKQERKTQIIFTRPTAEVIDAQPHHHNDFQKHWIEFIE